MFTLCFSNIPIFVIQVKDSWLDVHLCQEGSPGCGVSNTTNRAGILKFPKRSTEEMVMRILTRLVYFDLVSLIPSCPGLDDLLHLIPNENIAYKID